MAVGLRKYVAKLHARDEREAYRRKIAALRKRAREAKAERRRKLADQRAACKARRQRAEQQAQAQFRRALQHARDKQRAETERRNARRAARIAEARELCALEAAAIKDEADARIALARAEEREERRHRRELERGDKQQRARKRAQRVSAKVRRSESDDRVRANIPKRYLPLWETMKAKIKGSPRMSRSEEFMLWVHEHPEAIAELELEQVPSDDELAAAEAAYYEQQRGDVAPAAYDYDEAVPF